LDKTLSYRPGRTENAYGNFLRHGSKLLILTLVGLSIQARPNQESFTADDADGFDRAQYFKASFIATEQPCGKSL
jgi:hypothetical protein